MSKTGLQAMARKAFAACAALAFAAAAPAHATDYLFDFGNLNSSTQTFSLSGDGNGNVASFTKTGGDGSTLSMNMSAWSINSAKTRIHNAILDFHGSSGAGIDNRYESGSSPNHAIDNKDGVDFLVLQFNQAVDLNGIDIGWVDGDSDATVRWSAAPVTPWSTVPNWHDETLSVLNGLGITGVNGGSSAGPMRDVTGTGNALSNFWIISAADPNPVEGSGWKKKSKTDYFKLQALVVNNYPPVPEPGTWMMMIVGFGGIGWTMRRRRTTDTAMRDGMSAHA